MSVRPEQPSSLPCTRLLELIESGTIDLITSDVFDTVVTRPVATPSDLFVELGRRLHLAGAAGAGGVRRGVRRRRASPPSTAPAAASPPRPPTSARRSARSRRSGPRCPSTGSTMRSATPRSTPSSAVKPTPSSRTPSWSDVFTIAERRAVPVVLVSDTYLSADQLRRVLSGCGVDLSPIADVVTSSEHRTGKAKGLLARRDRGPGAGTDAGRPRRRQRARGPAHRDGARGAGRRHGSAPPRTPSGAPATGDRRCQRTSRHRRGCLRSGPVATAHRLDRHRSRSAVRSGRGRPARRRVRAVGVRRGCGAGSIDRPLSAARGRHDRRVDGARRPCDAIGTSDAPAARLAMGLHARRRRRRHAGADRTRDRPARCAAPTPRRRGVRAGRAAGHRCPRRDRDPDPRSRRRTRRDRRPRGAPRADRGGLRPAACTVAPIPAAQAGRRRSARDLRCRLGRDHPGGPHPRVARLRRRPPSGRVVPRAVVER